MKARPRIVVHNHFKTRDTGSLEEASNEVKRLYRELKATTEGASAYRELKKRYEAALKHEEAMVQGAGRGFGQKVGGREARLISGLLRGRYDAAATKSLQPGEAKATGASLVDYLDTSGQVRNWCREQGYSRITEGYMVEGFKQQRKRDGLSENV